MLKLRLPDGSDVERPQGSTAADALSDIKEARKAVAAKVDGRVVDLSHPLDRDAALEPVLPGTPDGLEILRHTTAHVMAQAVARHFGIENVEFAIGPVIDDGFYYDFELPRPLTDEDLPAIEKIMGEIRKENLAIERLEAEDREDALRIIRAEPSKSRFKQELIAGFPVEETVSFYRQGEFTDLCRGPHLPSTGRVAFFKLLSVAGAYWRGDEKREQLQRLYATAFFDKAELKEFLHRRAEAERRDHRKVGTKLDLFRVLPEAPGFPFWLPKGTIIFNELQAYVREKLRIRGYDEVRTPLILTADLWKRSGHYDHYRDNMYFTESEEREFAVKPMNCPGAALIFKQGLRSYRELPLRLSEFGHCHRYERSGTLSGLSRVRGFVQDDAHIFCTMDQLHTEVLDLLALAKEMYGEIGLGEPTMLLSTRPEDRTGSDEMWDVAEAALERALVDAGVSYQVAPGDGAFYGPKIDFTVTDAIGRPCQLATVQADFGLGEKFDLAYVAEDDSRQRPVVIHRAIYGSFERFVALLIEHYVGAFPLWLSPEQAVVLPVSEERHADASRAALAALEAAGLRARVDSSSNKLGKKIREASMGKVPYLLVIGDREADAGTLAVRRRDGTDCGAMSVTDLVAALVAERDSRAVAPTLGEGAVNA